MSGQKIVNKIYRELVSPPQTSADAFAAERNRRFRRLLEHHVHNARNTAYADLWCKHGLDPLSDMPSNLADVERLPLVNRQFLREADYASHPAVPDELVANRVRTSSTTSGVPLSFPVSLATRKRIYPELLMRSFVLIGAGDVLLDHSYHIAHFSNNEIKTGTEILFDDDYLIEVLDEHGHHVTPGERGRIAITSFATNAFPLTRYLIGDAATCLGRDDAFPNATSIAEIGRAVGAIIGDAKISFEEIGRMAYEMTLRGVQLARRKTVDGRDQLIMRLESPLEDAARISEVVLAVLRLNHHLDEALFCGDENPLLPLPLIEVYRPGELRKGQFKLPAFVDESHLAAIERSAEPLDR